MMRALKMTNATGYPSPKSLPPRPRPPYLPIPAHLPLERPMGRPHLPTARLLLRLLSLRAQDRIVQRWERVPSVKAHPRRIRRVCHGSILLLYQLISCTVRDFTYTTKAKAKSGIRKQLIRQAKVQLGQADECSAECRV